MREPVRYYETNVGGSIALCLAMAEAGVQAGVQLSATVYLGITGDADHRGPPHRRADQPHGQSKLMAENVLKGLADSIRAGRSACCATNPIGAHESGLIGEDPTAY
ncbi:NAD-dependent epimerase/dehydratase family protein [Stutzerimonas xanthomarina]|uniref:NAD-dependent epimerase/dehydratase family protein n=1 Tax=Stutzerimonas xanthomarina TaxID=271420 RepID=UPI003AA92428